MTHTFPHKSLKDIIYKTALVLVFLIAIFSISVHHITEFMKENDNREPLSTNALIPVIGLGGSLLIIHGIIWVLTLKDLIKVWQVYSFDDTCMKMSVWSVNLKTIPYKEVTKIEVNNSESNETCKIYYQNKHIIIDRDALHYIDMKLLWLKHCENAELIEN